MRAELQGDSVFPADRDSFNCGMTKAHFHDANDKNDKCDKTDTPKKNDKTDTPKKNVENNGNYKSDTPGKSVKADKGDKSEKEDKSGFKVQHLDLSMVVVESGTLIGELLGLCKKVCVRERDLDSCER